MPTLVETSYRLASSPTVVVLTLGLAVVIPLHALMRPRKLLVWLPSPPVKNWFMGHFMGFVGPGGSAFHEHLISTYGPTLKINAGLGEEVIFSIDPSLTYAVMVKDKVKFGRPEGGSILVRSILGNGLFGIDGGEEHRMQRKILNPVFTMKYLRELMPVFMGVAKQTSEGIKKDTRSSSSPSKGVDVFPWANIAALELIGEAELGYSFESFTGRRNEYYSAIKSITQLFSRVAPFMKILPYIHRIGTPSLRRWILRCLPFGTIQTLLRAVEVQNTQAEEVVKAREALISAGVDLSSQAGRGRDILTLLMKANEAEGSESYIDRQGIIGNMNIFVFAGHETTSTAVARILEVLTTRPDIQDKLRAEIVRYFEENQHETHHDALLELPYLDGIVRETLRLYEPLSINLRECKEDAILPLQYPINTPSGTLTSIPVKKGTTVLMSTHESNRSERIWGEDSREFKPERWIGKKLEEVTQPGEHLPGVFSSIMTFGAGSRSCIGFKFAVMEIKVLIAQLLNDFKFEPSEDDCIWESYIIQFPYLKGEEPGPSRLPKLPLKVTVI